MIPITTASKPVKYTGINSTKEVKELYSEKKKRYWWKKPKNTQISGKVSHVCELENGH